MRVPLPWVLSVTWLLCGCTELPYIPTEPPSLELDSGDSGDTVDIPCSEDRQPLTQATFTVINATADTVELLWRNGSCQEAFYQTLRPGVSVTQGTYVGHVWVVRDDSGRARAWFVVEEPGPSTVEVR